VYWCNEYIECFGDLLTYLQAIWGKSADVCLQTRGDRTHIDYEQRFDEYLEILTTGLRKKSPSILRVFSEWDRVVFPNAEASHVDPGKNCRGKKSDGFNRAMEALEEEAGQENGPGDGDGEREG
jgi:hypothetical protein